MSNAEQTQTRIDAILDYWLADRSFDEARLRFWFGGSEAIDAYIRSHFETDLLRAARGELEHWKTTPEGWLALIILLDQFSRNIYRGTAKAFAQDAQALALSLEGISQGIDRHLKPIERVFFYMPMQHAEDREIQKRSVQAFEELLGDVPAEERRLFEGFLDYAIRHREIIERFGRFPDLNMILGRRSTPEEIEFLKQPGSSFL